MNIRDVKDRETSAMTELPPMTDEFRSWVTGGLEDGAKWMAVMYDFDDHLDYPVYFNTDEQLNAFRAEWGSDIVYLFELNGSEEEVVAKIMSYWAKETESVQTT